MSIYHKPTKTKSSGTGGKRLAMEGKKLAYFGSPPTNSKVGAKDVRVLKNVRGSGKKVKLKSALYINLVGKDGKMMRAKLKKVTDNPDNRHFTRQNILTKGAIVDTDAGSARITNRVGQDGVVNGRLI